MLGWPRGREIGLVCTRSFSFHEFYNFLLFNFLILFFLEAFFLPTTFTHTHTHDPHPWPTTSTHDPRPTTLSYTPKRCVETYSPTNAVARKTPRKGIKKNTLRCCIDHSQMILMEKVADLKTQIHKPYTEIKTLFQNVQIWRRNKIKYRKEKLSKQNENYQTDWADAEWHTPRAKTINSPMLSHEQQRASIPCRQNINFWLIRSHVSQSSEITFF